MIRSLGPAYTHCRFLPSFLGSLGPLAAPRDVPCSPCLCIHACPGSLDRLCWGHWTETCKARWLGEGRLCRTWQLGRKEVDEFLLRISNVNLREPFAPLRNGDTARHGWQGKPGGGGGGRWDWGSWGKEQVWGLQGIWTPAWAGAPPLAAAGGGCLGALSEMLAQCTQAGPPRAPTSGCAGSHGPPLICCTMQRYPRSGDTAFRPLNWPFLLLGLFKTVLGWLPPVCRLGGGEELLV